MNAKELIDLLKNLPPDKKVVIRGYEDGFNDIKELKTVSIVYQSDSPWYYGEYALSNDPDAIEAIELFGENKNEIPL
jgi:hypothetical protein